MMDDLKHLLLIAERGTFTQAARAAHLTQPALSVSVRRLEQAFGARLLDRGRHGAELTAAGREVASRARVALSAIEDARRAVAELEGLDKGVVRLGAGATTATYLLPSLLGRFRKRHPGVRIVLRELTRDEALDQLESGGLDIAVLTGPDGEHWRDDAFVLVAAPGVRLEGAPFLTFPKGTVTREMLDRHFPEADIVMELGSIAAIKGHVAEGIGVALISRAAITRDLAIGRLVQLRHPATPIPRQLVLCHRGALRLPPAAAALRELMLSVRG
ncbi:MAG: LysR family transcriptional regulator [Sorangiineae bacterium PRO1]|nr:LysR family transcriptional regulator [Sorangiineae bacterium PRO1]